MGKELRAARSKAAIPVVEELLVIADAFERAVQNLNVEGKGEQAIVQRFEDLFEEIMSVWREAGVEKMQVVGAKFTPELHEAISMVPSEEYAADIVCAEVRGGWVMKLAGVSDPLVLRAALVCVSAGPGPNE